MPDKTKCGRCGKLKDVTTTFEVDGVKSVPICTACLKRLGDETGFKCNELSLADLPAELAGPVLAPKEIVALAHSIREKHHADRLQGARIAYILVPKPMPEDDERVSLGHARLVSKAMRVLTATDFVIQLSWPIWNTLRSETRRALLDHELTHCAEKLDKDGKNCGWRIEHHDVEDFVEVIDRHGLWTRDLELLAQSMRQLKLFEPVSKPAAAAVAPVTDRSNKSKAAG